MEKHNLIDIVKAVADKRITMRATDNTMCSRMWDISGSPLCCREHGGIRKVNCVNCPLITITNLSTYGRLWILKL